MTVERMCLAAGVSRARVGRKRSEEAEMGVRTEMQKIVLAHHRRYGYRCVTAELHRQGMKVNHKRVFTDYAKR